MDLPYLDLSQLDPGIRQTVALLRKHGFRTTDSGDGVSKGPQGPDTEHEPTPHVYMVVDDPYSAISEADRLYALLAFWGLASFAVVQVSYDPENRICILSMHNVDDSLLTSKVDP